MGSESSVLNDVKRFVMLPEEIKDFDDVLILHINTQLPYLEQLGYGVGLPNEIVDEDTTWFDVLGDTYSADVKSLIFLRVKLAFDTPAVGSVTAAIERQAKEAEWRALARREVIT